MRVGKTTRAVLKPALYLLVMLGIFTGCATSPNKGHGSTVANAAEPDKQCHVQNITGTFVKKYVCSTQADRDAEERSTEDLEYRVGTSEPVNLRGGGNGH
jgi:hypothetical protein